jgi:glycosyltransferase involved in cell wall biosynthesis
MRVWIDVEDLFVYFVANRRPSGIQRLAFELEKALRAVGGADRVRFVRHIEQGLTFGEVAWEEVEALFAGGVGQDAPRAKARPVRAAASRHPRLRRLVYRMPTPVRVALVRAGRSQIGVLRALGRALSEQGAALRGLVDLARALVPGSDRQRAALVPIGDVVRPGDVLAVLGSPWSSPNYAAMLDAARRVHGMRVLLLAYDLIPLRHPEWCESSLVWHFTRWLDSCLPLTDIVLAISRSSARDLDRYAAEKGIALHGPVGAIPIGTGFGTQLAALSPAAADDLPPAGTYALFVSTIEARKNHQLLFRVWRRLLDEMPADAVPTLVFAGKRGWLVADLMQQLDNVAWFDGKVVHVDNPSDAELVQLYRGCLFTLFPSLYEGWGLPVTESLALGKPCIISNVTSLPEAGGALARYFNPDDLADVVRVIREAISDRPGLAEWEARVRRDFRPVSWEESAHAILESIG